MSEPPNKELTEYLAVGEDWDWEQIQEVWERASGIIDYFKRQETPIEWVSRGVLFAAMQTALLENGGDVAVAKANLIDLIQISFSYVADQLVSAMELAWETGEVEGQKLNPPEKARLKDNLETLKQGIELDQIPMLNEKELQSVLSAQDALAEKAEEVGVAFGQPATVLAICAMFIQSMLFANDGDVVAAKAHALRAMHQIWPVAIHTSQKLVEGAIAVAEDGPPEGRPN